jgi:hypothetical protein
MVSQAQNPGAEDQRHFDVEPGLDDAARSPEHLHQGERHDAGDEDFPGRLDPEMHEPPPPEQVNRHVADGRKSE